MKIKKGMLLVMIAVMVTVGLTGCDRATSLDVSKTLELGNKLAENQPTPDDIEYSLERYNLSRRTYWVNGQREKANSLPCPVEKPLGYILLVTNSGSILNRFVVDGKVSSLNSFLTPDSEYYEGGSTYNDWLPDVDGSYGENDSGIFFFTPDGNYLEWTGDYLYSDIPFEVEDPILKVGEAEEADGTEVSSNNSTERRRLGVQKGVSKGVW